MSFATRLAAALLAVVSTSALMAQNPQPTLTPFASGLSLPIDVTHAGDGTDRLFVNEKGGKIKVLAADGAPIGTFLDLSAKVTTNSERGLLGLAFAPDYPTSGRFYVNYSNLSGNTTIARYTVSATDPNLADPASAEVLLTIPQPYANHNGGDLAFGPDGLLYVASGDGGSGDDPQANAQNLNTLLGAILRLDVSGASGYVAAGGYPGARAEIFVAGLRNPWRISFAPGSDTLYIGDVGQGAREEIDVVTTADAGQNFGWVCWEGSRDNRGVASAASSNCQPFAAYAAPWYEYDRAVGRSVTGGVVYRGAEYPALRDYYVFADYASARGFAVRGVGATRESNVIEGFGTKIVGFGESESGEVYVVQLADETFSPNSGQVYRLTSSVPLPVSVIEFAAEREYCDAVVRWVTEDERDLSHYELEVAGEDLQWAAFAKTYPGASDGRYEQRLSLDNGRRYARLVSVDLDGTRVVGEILRLNGDCASRLYSYPNPVRGGADVTVSLANGTDLVTVTDALGRVVVELAPRGLARLSFPTAALPRGHYVVRQAGQVTRVVVAE